MAYIWGAGGVSLGEIRGRIVPNWCDPATLGCLLALVREAWGDDLIYFGSSLDTQHGRWSWVRMYGDIIGSGDSEAGALVAALEAAP